MEPCRTMRISRPLGMALLAIIKQESFLRNKDKNSTANSNKTRVNICKNEHLNNVQTLKPIFKSPWIMEDISGFYGLLSGTHPTLGIQINLDVTIKVVGGFTLQHLSLFCVSSLQQIHLSEGNK